MNCGTTHCEKIQSDKRPSLFLQPCAVAALLLFAATPHALPDDEGTPKAVVAAGEIGTAVKVAAASVVFGGGVETPVVTLSPMLFEKGWTSHGSVGTIGHDNQEWHRFEMRTAKSDESPKIEGRVRFSETGDGAVRGEWIAMAKESVDLEELLVGGTLSLSDFAGGTLVVDGSHVAIPAENKSMHVFRGSGSDLRLLDRNGVARLHVVFDEPTRFLFQDNRSWGGMSFSLRLFLAEGRVERGREYCLTATVAVPADGPLVLSRGNGVRIVAGEDWIPIALEPWIEPRSALDFSEVLPHHAPAGKYGRVLAVGDHFEFENRPGVPQRFYGVNICGDANVPSTDEAAERFAANLARIGYNSLRIHHHERALLGNKPPKPDATPASQQGAATPASQLDGAAPTSKLDGAALQAARYSDTTPDPAAMERFDALIAACVRHGIYVTTDLFVSRSWFTTWRSLGIDRDGCIQNTADYKMLCAFWEPAFTNLCEWSRNFLCHRNPHTGRTLAEEPALCALALVNEGNLGNWGGAGLRRTPGVQEAWERWLDERREEGFDWSSIPRTIPDELYADDGSTPERRHSAAFAIFLADMEQRLASRLTAFLRDELKCQVPLSSLSCWYNPVQYQLPRTTFDYVDDHFYVDHPSFLGKSWKLPSRCPNVNPMRGSAAGARSVAFRRLFGKPFCITEWNYAGPGRYRGVGGIATGVQGALQDWSGMWRFAWSHGRAGVESPETKTLTYFDMSGDPLGLAAERAALCLFLRGDVPPLKAEYPVCLGEDDLRNPANGAPKCQAGEWLWAAWHAKLGTRVIDGDGSHAESAESAPSPYESLVRPSKQVRADLASLGATEPGGGAVSIDPDTGTFLIDTPRTAGGFAECGAHAAGPLRWELCAGTATEAKNPDKSVVLPAQSGKIPVPATIWVSSLDGTPIASSSRLLLTHLTDVQNSGISYADEGLTILLDWGKLPHVMRNGRAGIELRREGLDSKSQIHVYRLSPSGRRIAEVPVETDLDNGTIRFEARTDWDATAATFLYEILVSS